MKKTILLSIALFISAWSMAQQQQLSFPFQGGSQIMTRFFKDSLTVSPEIVKSRASGVVVFKFTADDKGIIKKMVMYYADDAILVPPVIDALKRSSHKWIIPDKEKVHDFIITFSINFNPPAKVDAFDQKAVYQFNTHKKPILSINQVPLDMATLLPTVVVNYDLK